VTAVVCTGATVVVSAEAKAAKSIKAVKKLKILLISSIYEVFALNCRKKRKVAPKKRLAFCQIFQVGVEPTFFCV
jgi:ribosomal 50S subunit-recycling heat shock protein